MMSVLFITVLVTLLASNQAFLAPSTRRISSNVVMKLGENAQGLIGSDLEWPEFDPLGFTKDASPEKVAWYRAAELKHGRVAMLASLGQIFQYYWRLPDEVFNQGDKPFKALEQIFHERPLAAVQIILAIFAVEALGQFNQVKPGQAPGDLGWDPLGLKPSDPEVWESVQLRELKNGRLAMIALAAYTSEHWLPGSVPFIPGKF
mmetsp:Transcript_1637/g.1708  ORF Transcript_1637/g.1708 Transcript_1637/m.1708 type:complete len:204 (-) Transcript_1637:144-755(-)